MTGKIIRKETLNKHEQSIWDALQEHRDEFHQYHGYSVDDVKKIGIRKFLKMEDWKGPEDVTKFKTDVMHVVICPHCRDEFGLAEDIFGFCKKCKHQFDLKQMMDLANLVGKRATATFASAKGLSEEEVVVLMESAIQYAEFAFRRLIQEASFIREAESGVESDGTLMVEAVFSKNQNLVMRTENATRINELLESIKRLVEEQLNQVYVFDHSETTEV